MRRIKLFLLLGGIGTFYLSVTLVALTVGLIAEAGRETVRSQSNFRRVPGRRYGRGKEAGGYLAVMGMVLSLVGIWATLVTIIA